MCSFILCVLLLLAALECSALKLNKDSGQERFRSIEELKRNIIKKVLTEDPDMNILKQTNTYNSKYKIYYPDVENRFRRTDFDESELDKLFIRGIEDYANEHLDSENLGHYSEAGDSMLSSMFSSKNKVLTSYPMKKSIQNTGRYRRDLSDIKEDPVDPNVCLIKRHGTARRIDVSNGFRNKTGPLKIYQQYHSCGSDVKFDADDSVLLFMHPFNGDCRINITISKYSAYQRRLVFSDRKILKFPNCNSGYLDIIQDKTVQRYCGGDFSLGLFPTDAASVQLHLHVKENSSHVGHIFLRVSSVKIDNDVFQIFSKFENTKSYVDYRSQRMDPDRSGEIRTFNPKESIDQICPKECGGQRKYPTDSILKVLPGEVTGSDYPWLVSVYVSSPFGLEIHGGVILTKNTILTTAALQRRNISEIVVKTRSNRARRRQIIPIRNIAIKSNFEKIEGVNFYIGDYTVLQLKNSLKLGSDAVPVCIAPELDYHNKYLYAFYYRHAGRKRIHDMFMKRKIYIQNERYCSHFINITSENRLSQRHAGEYICYMEEANIDIPKGSPLMANINNSWFLVGIVSSINKVPYGSSDSYTIMAATNITKYSENIHKMAKSFEWLSYDYCA